MATDAEVLREESEAIRGASRKLRLAVEENTQIQQAVLKELVRFNENLEAGLEAVQALLPMLEGASAGAGVIGAAKTALGLFTNLRARRATGPKK